MEVAAALVRGFEASHAPVQVSDRSYERRFRSEGLDPFASRVFERAGDPMGVLLVARRGWTARIAGLGLAPEVRGLGLGRRVMGQAIEEARVRGDRALLLDVFERNERAVAFYTGLGFSPVRRLVGYQRAPGEVAPGTDALSEVDPLELARVVAREGEPDLPWMLAPETLSAAAAPARAFTLDGRAYALVGDATEEELLLSALVVPRALRRRGWGSRMLRALTRAFPGHLCSVAPIVPENLAPGFFIGNGWERPPRDQLEMRLDL